MTDPGHAWALYLLDRFAEGDSEVRLVTDGYVRRFGPEYPIVLAARQLWCRTGPRSAMSMRRSG
ncbi:hypothetical protein [Streptomyces sp. Tu102]|uniref:hypothetical protein n=1 Tax=Streptomyces sp. Tu102 TaxID=2838019 RepID=UPI00202A3B8A|nr:hypothetical protein [Streptomyces sp. Tu102]